MRGGDQLAIFALQVRMHGDQQPISGCARCFVHETRIEEVAGRFERRFLKRVSQLHGVGGLKAARGTENAAKFPHLFRQVNGHRDIGWQRHILRQGQTIGGQAGRCCRGQYNQASK